EALMGGFELGLGLLECGDVLRNAEGADDTAILIAPRNLGRDAPGDFAVRLRRAFDFADDGLTGLDDLLFVLLCGAGALFGEGVEIGFADEPLAKGVGILQVRREIRRLSVRMLREELS